MDSQIPITLRSRVNGITVEVCHGKIPEIFQQLRFDPITEPELPDTKGTDEEFQRFLHHYRDAYQWLNDYLLE